MLALKIGVSHHAIRRLARRHLMHVERFGRNIQHAKQRKHHVGFSQSSLKSPFVLDLIEDSPTQGLPNRRSVTSAVMCHLCDATKAACRHAEIDPSNQAKSARWTDHD